MNNQSDANDKNLSNNTSGGTSNNDKGEFKDLDSLFSSVKNEGLVNLTEGVDFSKLVYRERK